MIYLMEFKFKPPIFRSPDIEKAKKHIQKFYLQDPSMRRQQKYNNPKDGKLRQEFLPETRLKK